MISLPYVSLFCFFICSALLEHKLIRHHQISLVRLFVIIIAVIFFGLRGHVLTDFINYYEFFHRLNSSQLDLTESIFEPGFILLTYLIKQISGNYHFWIFILSTFHVATISIIFKRYLGNISLGLVFFLAYRGIALEFNLLQNFTAICFFLLSINYLHQRRITPYMLLNLIGVSIHLSSIIYIPLYFILNRNFGMKTGLIVIAVSNIMYIFGSEALLSLIYFFLETTKDFSSLAEYLRYFVDNKPFKISFGFIERTLLILLIVIYYEKIKSNLLHGQIFYNMALIYYASFLLLSPIDVLAGRIPSLFLLAYWLVPPAMIIIKHRYRTIIASFLLAVSFSKLILSVQDKVSAYDNLLFGIESFEERKADVLEHNRKKNL